MMKLALLALASLTSVATGQVPPVSPPASKMQGSALDKPTTSSGAEITKEQVMKMRTLDLSQVNEQGPGLNGEVLKLRFNYRSRATTPRPDGGLSGRVLLWRTPGGNAVGKYRSGSISVSVPPEGVPWFTKIPSEEESRTSIVVIARISNNGQRAELLGREIKTDLKGPQVVW